MVSSKRKVLLCVFFCVLLSLTPVLSCEDGDRLERGGLTLSKKVRSRAFKDSTVVRHLASEQTGPLKPVDRSGIHDTVPTTTTTAAPHKEHKVSALGHKIGAFFVVLGIGITGCGAPYYLQRLGLTRKVMPFVNSFACGAFLGLAIFHLLPEALHVTDELNVGFDVGKSWYNLTFLFAFLGFILIMFFEKILVVGVASRDASYVVHTHESDLELNKFREAGKERTCTCPADCPDTVRNDNGPTDCSVAYIDNNSKDNEAMISFSPTALFASLSLSVHSLFEGLIIGMFPDVVTVWVATLSISGHKWAAGFALAVNCINKRVKKKAAFAYLSVFILSSPIGIIVGIFVSQGDSVLVGVIDGISLGTILYTGCELLFEEFHGGKKVLREAAKFACTLVGAFVVFGLMMLHLAKGAHVHGHPQH